MEWKVPEGLIVPLAFGGAYVLSLWLIKQPSLCDSDDAVAGSVSLPFGRRSLFCPHLPPYAASINLEAEAGGESPPGLNANYTPPASAAHNKADCTNPRLFRGECRKCQQILCAGSSLELVDTWVTSLCLQGRWISDTPSTWAQDMREMFGPPTPRQLTESDFSHVDYAPKEMDSTGQCRNCKAMGHFARDCPEEKQMTGECFNCGEVGHNKANYVLWAMPSRSYPDAPKLTSEMGHFARDCPEEKQMTGECFTCDEAGHNKADCTNPRAFRGECRHCKQEGHPAAECPDKPATLCRNCEQEGHTVFLAGNICTKDKGKILVHEVGH
ncbi:hypothetical protein IWZ01DRAFT_545970 [Phyllosticta capitalensis]